MQTLTKLNKIVTQLPRGGYLLDSPAGYIQFGVPPETIKDTMGLPKSVPQYFVLPRELFHRQKGISIAELEFPIYYNFFIKKKKTYIICQQNQAGRLIRILKEAVFGPKDLSLTKDIYPDQKKVVIPMLKKEMDYFKGNIGFKDILGFIYFRNNQCRINDVLISIDQNRDFIVSYGQKEIAHIPGIIEYIIKYDIGERMAEPYKAPLFGITCLGPSHGFDPTANTSGFIIWLNHSGIMVDPPVNSTEWLRDSNVNPKLIDSIILTHCHADHDAGTFQKILEEEKINIYTTNTVINSFLTKYSYLSNESLSYLKKLFKYYPVYIKQPVYIHGGEFRFFYTLHSIPTVGFTLKYQDKSFIYSSDHQADPDVQKKLLELGIIKPDRYAELQNFPFSSDIIYHESGIPPLHTPISFLNSLPVDLQKKITVYHIAKKDFPQQTDLTLATFGIKNTFYIEAQIPEYEKTYELLELVKHLDFFDSLCAEKAQEFITIVRQEKFKKGNFIFQKGTIGNKFYIIKTGNVAITNKELKERIVLGKFEYFGEIAILTKHPRTADVMAETDVELLTIDKNKFLSFISNTDFEQTLHRLVRNRERGVWNVLFDSPFFRRMTSYQKTWFESILNPLDREIPGVIIEEGKPIEKIFIIVQGEVTVSKQGREVALLKRGDFIGSMYRVQRKEKAEYTFAHKVPLLLLSIEKQDIIDFLEKNPGLGMMHYYHFYKKRPVYIY